MVEGPFTKQEAANRCGCSPSQLCPGPMAAIDEGDKIRTIYDGSFGGANSHIQQNTSEKTTAPTVMDCMHGIHWIHASSSGASGDHTAVSQGERATARGVDSEPQGGGTWSWPGPDTTLLLLKADVSKAHRRIKILPSGWKYQVAQIDQQWWVNKVGYACFTMHFPRWTGDLSLWMIFVGFYGPHIATHLHRQFLPFWLHWECL